jgi:hypothetical protein
LVKLGKKRNNLKSVEAYACVCILASCTCHCNCDCTGGTMVDMGNNNAVLYDRNKYFNYNMQYDSANMQR